VGRYLKSLLEESMAAFPEVPGIVEGAMTITPEPDGRMSIRVLINADGERTDYCDRIELIISPEHVRHALAGIKIRALASTETADMPPAFPCHIGLYRNAAHTAA
jgi:hypothetical protein